MQFLNYFFASVISALGLLIGVVLVRVAPEEQKPLAKYFSMLRMIFLFLIFAFPLFYYFKNTFYAMILASFFVILLFIEYKFMSMHLKCAWSYSLFGILFVMSRQNINLFAIESALMLLYGVPSASLIYSRKKKNYYKVFLGGLLFLIVANLLYFTTSRFLF